MQRRTELLLGEENLNRIQQAKVLIFGLGGVGSWCAESLVRSGLRNLTLVDSDRICITNCNRQLMATSKTLGQVKVEALRDRLLEINPDANIVCLQKIYEAETADSFHMEEYDFIVDAIDSLKDKVDLILRVTALPKHITFISSMGAALRRDSFMVRKAEFWKVKGDPLAQKILVVQRLIGQAEPAQHEGRGGQHGGYHQRPPGREQPRAPQQPQRESPLQGEKQVGDEVHE